MSNIKSNLTPSQRYAEYLKKKDNNQNSDYLSPSQRYSLYNKYNSVDTSAVNQNYLTSFTSDAGKFFEEMNDINSADESVMERLPDLKSRATAARAFVYQNKDSLEENTYNELSSSFDEILKRLDNYSQFESKDDYNKAISGWLNLETDTTVETALARQARYDANAKRIEELDEQIRLAYAAENAPKRDWLSIIGNAINPYSSTNDWNGLEGITYKQQAPEVAALISEREALEAENNQYRRLQGVLDDYFEPITSEMQIMADSTRESLKNATNEEIYEAENGYGYIDTLWTNGSVRLDDNGNIINAVTGEIVYKADEYTEAYSNGIDSLYNKLIEDKLALYLNASEQEKTEAKTKIAQSMGNYKRIRSELLYEGYRNAWEKLNEDEITTYYRIYGEEGQEAAYKFLDDMATVLTYRETVKRAEAISEASVLEKIFMNIAVIPMSVFGGIAAGISAGSDLLSGKEINPYSKGFMLTNDANAIRTVTAQALDELTGNISIPFIDFSLGDAYLALMSTGDSMLASFIPGGYMLLGLNAATSTMKDTYERGGSQAQVLANGILAGAAEMIFEKVSIERFLDTKDIKSFGDFVINALKQGGVEASEEVFTEIANTISDAVIMGGEASVRDLQTFVSNVLNAAAGGFLSGSVMGGVASVRDSVAYGKQVREYGQALLEKDGVEPLMSLANNMSGVVSKSDARGLNRAVTRAEKKPSAKNVGRLYDVTKESISKQNSSDIENALIDKGMTKSEAKKATDYLLGNESTLTDAEKARIKNDANVSKVAEELLDNQNSKLNERTRRFIAAKMGIKIDADSSGELSLRNNVELEGRISNSGKSVDISSGKEIVIDKSNPIAKTKYVNGKRIVYLNTNNGVIEASNIQYANADEALLYESFADMNPAFANAIIKNYDGSVPLQTYINGMREGVILYGMHNFQAVGKDISSKSFLASLSEADQAFALKLGRAYSKADAKKADNNLHKAIKNAKERAEAKRNDTEKTSRKPKRGRVYFEDGAKAEGHSQKKAVKLARILSSAIGIDIAFYDSTLEGAKHKDSNGYFSEKDNTIHLDLQKSNDDAKTIAFTMAHELVHFVKKWSPRKFEVLANFLTEQYAVHNVNSASLLKRKMVELNTTDIDFAYEEMICDACETMLLDTNAVVKLMELRKLDLGVFEKVKLHIYKLINDIRAEYKKRSYAPSSDEAKALLKMDDILSAFYEHFENAVVDAAKTYQDGGHLLEEKSDNALEEKHQKKTVQKVTILNENNELYQEILNSGRSASSILKEYIQKVYANKTIIFNDGRTAIVDNNDSKELAKRAGKIKAAEIAQLDEIIQNAALVEENVKATHRKFDSFSYYKAVVKYGEKTIEILLNVGHGKFDSQNHLYAITDYIKKGNTAGLKDLARPVGTSLQSGIPNNSISQKTNLSSDLDGNPHSDRDYSYEALTSHTDIESKTRTLNSYVQRVAEVTKMSDTVALSEKGRGAIYKISAHTPDVILKNIKNSRDLEMIIRFDALYLATRKDGVLKGHYHNLGQDVMSNIMDYISKPDAIVLMDNGRHNVFTQINGGKGIISVEFDATKDVDAVIDKYNLIVTVFSAKDNYIKNLLSEHGLTVEYKKDGLKQVNSQLYEWLTIIDNNPSDNSVSQNSEKSTASQKNSQTNASNSRIKAIKQAREKGEVSLDMQSTVTEGQKNTADTYGDVRDAYSLKKTIKDAVNKIIKYKGKTGDKYDQIIISNVPQNVSKYVEVASNGNIDLADKNVSLNGNDLWHEYNRHSQTSVEVGRRQIPLTPETISEAVEAIYSPDIIECIFASSNNPTQRQSFAYVKKSSNGHYIVVEVVGGKRNPTITPRMIVEFTEEKWNNMINSGQTIGEVIFENNPRLKNALDIEFNKKNRVIVAQFASKEAIASTPHSPRFNNSISQKTEKSTEFEKIFQKDFSNSQENTLDTVKHQKKKSSSGTLKDNFFGKSLENYKEKDYNNFGWIRYNNIVSSGYWKDFTSKFADLKSGSEHFFMTKNNEYIIPVNDLSAEGFGIDNVLIYAKGTIESPIIMKVVKINLYDEASIVVVREDIYERQGIIDENYLDGVFDVYYAKDFSYERARRETVRQIGSIDRRNELGRGIASSTGEIRRGEKLSEKHQLKRKSDRALLAGVIASSIDTSMQSGQNELKCLIEYQEKVKEIEAEEAHLLDLEAEIRKLSAVYGENHPDVKKLSDDKKKSKNNIKTYNNQLQRLGAKKPIIDLLERTVEEARKEAEIEGERAFEAYRDKVLKTQDEQISRYKAHAKEMKLRAAVRKDKSALRKELRKVIKSLRSLFNNGTKKKNVKQEMRNTVESVLTLSELLFSDNIRNEDIVRLGVERATEKETEYLVKYSALLEARDNLRERLDEVNKDKNAEEADFDEFEKLQKEFRHIEGQISYLDGKLEDLFKRERAGLSKDTVDSIIAEIIIEYSKLGDSENAYIREAYNEGMKKRLEALMVTLEGTRVSDMDVFQLSGLYDVLKGIEHTVKAANKLFRQGRAEDRNAFISDVQSELSAVASERADKGALANSAEHLANSFSWNNLRPVDAFARLGSKSFEKLFWDFIHGQAKAGRDIWEAGEFLARTREKYNYSTWELELADSKPFMTRDGMSFNPTLADKLSIYAYSQRDKAERHIEDGGFIYQGKVSYKDEKSGKRLLRASRSDTYRLSKENVKSICATLTQEQRDYVDTMLSYLTEMGKKGNEVSMTLYGIEIFNEKVYFPLQSARDYINSKDLTLGATMTTSSLVNSGFTQPTAPNAGNPIVLRAFDDVWLEHTEKMSNYHALVIPIENLRRVFDGVSFDENGSSVSTKSLIGSRFGKEAQQYFEQLIIDMNGGVKLSGAKSPVGDLFSKAKGIAVGANLSVVAQQYFSIFRAMEEISPKYFMPFLYGNAKKTDIKQYEELIKYAPIAIIKEMGGFDVGSSGRAKDYIGYIGTKWDAKRVGKTVKDSMMLGAETMDKLGWSTIWKAVKAEVAAKQGLTPGTDTFFEACNLRFTEVVTMTQVYDSVGTRSGYMRSKYDAMKYATSFMGEPTVMVGRQFIAAIKLYRAVRSGDKPGIKAAAIKLARTETAILVAGILANLAKSLIYAGRDDEDDEAFLEKWARNFAGALRDDINILNSLPFGRDIVSATDGYSVERPDMTLVSEMISAGKKYIKSFAEGETVIEKIFNEDFLNFLGKTGNFIGIPLSNIIREVKSLSNIIDDILLDDISPTDMKGALIEGFSGDERSRVESLYAAIVGGDVSRVDVIKASYKTESAYHTALRGYIGDLYRDNELSYSDAVAILTEYGGYDANEAYWKMKEWDFAIEHGEDADYSKYTEFYDAVKTGRDIKTVVNEYLGHGVSRETLAAQITSYFKPLYRQMTNTERAAIKGYLLNAYALLGYDRSKKSKDIDRWLYDND